MAQILFIMVSLWNILVWMFKSGCYIAIMGSLAVSAAAIMLYILGIDFYLTLIQVIGI